MTSRRRRRRQGRRGGKLQRAIRETDHRTGVDAMSLAELLVGAGLPPPEAQRAIQSALDGGVLRLGPHLRLYPNELASAEQAEPA